MLSDNTLKAFIPTSDAKKAKKFYKDILGLKLLTEDSYALEFEVQGALLRVTIVPDLKPQNFTVLGWNVPDILFEIKSLKAKGVIFEKYDFMEQDNLGIWTAPSGAKVAWFKDPDGNILSINQ